ncbi:MAG TPA: hypothetical protein VJT49_06455 [Amycolatopsis sp.]|uniref:hypothetical protein n=1 Tax=Amycolatopsis sp. TaxID=37632 RepID=UPI002B4A1070|nr:hypothetical protein [Amycolatopsis sp.]HKS44749.1 hypothetical protein [Amycolatopsis sp.]
MTSYPQAQAGYPQDAQTANRPGALTAALVLAAGAALAAIVDGILFITGAHDVAVSGLQEAAGSTMDSLRQLGGDELVDETVNQVVSTLNTRAYVTIVAAVLLLVFGLLSAKAATWARVLTTISAAAVLVMGLRLFSDIGTGLMQGLGALAAVLALGTIVVVWLPANARYAKAVKRA